jgi:hypothetical protein
MFGCSNVCHWSRNRLGPHSASPRAISSATLHGVVFQKPTVPHPLHPRLPMHVVSWDHAKRIAVAGVGAAIRQAVLSFSEGSRDKANINASADVGTDTSTHNPTGKKDCSKQLPMDHCPAVAILAASGFAHPGCRFAIIGHAR